MSWVKHFLCLVMKSLTDKNFSLISPLNPTNPQLKIQKNLIFILIALLFYHVTSKLELAINSILCILPATISVMKSRPGLRCQLLICIQVINASVIHFILILSFSKLFRPPTTATLFLTYMFLVYFLSFLMRKLSGIFSGIHIVCRQFLLNYLKYVLRW